MYKVLEKSSLWLSFKNTTELLKDIYLSKNVKQSVDTNVISTLIESFNSNRAYVYKTLPQYKFYFLSYYVVSEVIKNEFNLLGFLDFLLINGACLDGLFIIKNYLINALFKEQRYFDLLRYCFEVQKFKLEESLAFITYHKDRHLPGLREMIRVDAHHSEIEQKIISGSLISDDEIRSPQTDKKYVSELFFKSNSCIYFPEDERFLYFDGSGRLRLCVHTTDSNKELRLLINRGRLIGQQVLIANSEQTSKLELVIGQKINKKDLSKEHPIYFIQKHPHSPFSVYFFEHCSQITYAEETPLMVATRHSAYRLIGSLLNGTVAVDTRNNRGEDALAIAIQRNDNQALNFLIGRGASVLLPEAGYTAFHIAALYRHTELLRILACYAQLSCEKFGTLFIGESKALFHWITAYRLLSTKELIRFLASCDLGNKNEAHAQKMEQIIFSLFCFAYAQDYKELMEQLSYYLLEKRYSDDPAALIIKIASATMALPASFFPSDDGSRKKSNQDGFCSELELQDYITDLFINLPTKANAHEAALKLALFACQQNKPKIVLNLIALYGIDLKNALLEQVNLLQICLSTRAYSSAQWLIQGKNGYPSYGLNGLDLYIADSLGEKGHYGHQLVRDKQSSLLYILLSLGYFDELLSVPDHLGQTMLDNALITKQASMVAFIINYIQKLNATPGRSELVKLNALQTKDLLVHFFNHSSYENKARSPQFIPEPPSVHIVYSVFSRDMNYFISIVQKLSLNVNQMDQRGRTLISYLVDELQKGEITLASLRSFIQCLKPNVTYLKSKLFFELPSKTVETELLLREPVKEYPPLGFQGIRPASVTTVDNLDLDNLQSTHASWCNDVKYQSSLNGKPAINSTSKRNDLAPSKTNEQVPPIFIDQQTAILTACTQRNTRLVQSLLKGSEYTNPEGLKLIDNVVYQAAIKRADFDVRRAWRKTRWCKSTTG